MARTPAFISFRAAGVGGGVTDAQMFRIEPFSGYRWRGWTYGAHGTTDLKPLLSEADRGERLRDREVWFLIHGFNTDRDRGFMSSGAAVQEFMRLGVQADPAFPPFDDIMPVLWPGDAAGFKPIVGAAYPTQIEDVRETACRFASLLLDPATRPARINFITHSLGARVALDTLREMLDRDPMGPAPGTLLMMAPAADDDILDDPRFDKAVRALDRIVVLSSSRDRVLQWTFPAGDILEAILQRGRERTTARALGRFGPRLKADSPARGKTEWRHFQDWVGQDHNDYNAWPWAFAAKANGWDARRWRTHRFCRQAGVDHDASQPDAWREGDHALVAREPRLKS